MSYIKQFRVKPGSEVDLAKIDAGFKDTHESHEHALPEIETYTQKLHDLQYLMYAEGKRSLLICLQGRDAAGKDGTINHVLERDESAGLHGHRLQGAIQGRGGTRLSLALSPAHPRQGAGGDLQSLPVRGCARGSRARHGAEAGLVRAL